jgi:transposase-like protein
MAIKKDVLDELLAEADGKDVFGKNGLFDELKKALAERMLNAQMDHHLTQDAAEPGRNQANHRNGYSKKTFWRTPRIWRLRSRDRAATMLGDRAIQHDCDGTRRMPET